jgi:lipopolysaccharide transport system ATP-binding protein
MQMRLAFSTSTAIRPEILVLDEWLSTGDEEFKEKSNNRLQEIVNSTKILILASHSKELLLANCNRIIWMEHGQVRRDGPAADVAREYFGG